nr:MULTISPECIES: alpha/beta hydrolase [unclassified Pseudomonas]
MSRYFVPEWMQFGPVDAPVVLLAMGVGEQLVHWPRSLIDGLVEAGYGVVVFDARDVGFGPRFDREWPADPRPVLGALAQGQDVSLPYTLDDMAGDMIAVLDALGAPSAHLVGISLGAMQAQLAAASFPTRVASLTSIMSNSGNPEMPPPNVEVTAGLIAPVNAGLDQAGKVQHFIAVRKPMAGSQFQRDEAEWSELALRSVTRAPPSGTVRQIAASMASRDRHLRLADITAPTLVLHGSDDPVMPMAGAQDTADRIPGARLQVVEGMGHDLSEALGAALVPVLVDHFRIAERTEQKEVSR